MLMTGSPSPSQRTLSFATADKPTVFALGVLPGDLVQVHREDSYRGLVIQMVADTPRVVVKTGVPFLPSVVGRFLYIEEGQDAGGYRVSSLEGTNTLVLDRSPTTSSPEVIKSSATVSWGWDAGNTRNILTVPANETKPDGSPQDNTNFFNGLVGKWVTLYHVPSDPNGVYWQGSYLITATFTDGGSIRGAVIDQALQMPTYPYGTLGHIVVTEPPAALPATITGASSVGTETVGGVPARIYLDVPEEYPVVSVQSDNGALSELIVTSSTLTAQYGQPYAIRRPNVRRINPQEMSLHKQGSLYYFDTIVSSLSPNPAANLKLGAYLTAKEGTYESVGYKHVVADPSLTYSMREDGHLLLPTSILPTFADDRKDNELSTLGSPVQVTYERSDVVQRLQDFLDSGEDRSTAADLLARHFLPTYITYEATYVGGSDTAVVAKDITDYINTLVVESPLDVSQIQSLIERRGGDPITPTTVESLIHDWQRKVWAEFSQNQLGPSTTVPYAGTPRVTFYVPGPDVSGQDNIPYGEHIKLVKT
jgi:hypothetical protein